MCCIIYSSKSQDIIANLHPTQIHNQHRLPTRYGVTYKNMDSAGRIPHEGRWTPPPRRVFPSKDKIPVSVGDQLQCCVYTSVQRADGDSWFYFRPSAHLQKMDLGWARAPCLPCERPRKPIWNNFLGLLRRRLCHPGVIITASVRAHRILRQLLLPVMISHNMHILILTHASLNAVLYQSSGNKGYSMYSTAGATASELCVMLGLVWMM